MRTQDHVFTIHTWYRKPVSWNLEIPIAFKSILEYYNITHAYKKSTNYIEII